MVKVIKQYCSKAHKKGLMTSWAWYCLKKSLFMASLNDQNTNTHWVLRVLNNQFQGHAIRESTLSLVCIQNRRICIIHVWSEQP